MAIKKSVKPKTVVKAKAVALKKPIVKKTVLKKTAVKQPAAKKGVAKKPVAKKAVVKKVAPKKVVIKKVVASVAVKKSAAKKQSAKNQSAKNQPYGIPEQLRDAALKVLDERQAKDIVCVDLRGRSALADYAIIASGNTGRQLGAMADYMTVDFEKLSNTHVRIDGLTEGDWVLIDAGDVIVHLFRPEVRKYYNIDDLLTQKPRSN